MKKRILFVFGTRPEAIKLAPVIHTAKKFTTEIQTIILSTAQHQQLLKDVLSVFNITPDIDLNIMTHEQSLYYLAGQIFSKMENILSEVNPDIVVVQGDTATTFSTAVSAYYARKKVAHVEAGLRSHNKFAPFPEEINRKITACVTDYHFAPTELARQNLLNEGYPDENIFVTGNTVIDALLWTLEQIHQQNYRCSALEQILTKFHRMILITGHRRENFGEPLYNICQSLKLLAERHPDICFIYPVHLNPQVRKPVYETLSGLNNFFLVSPLSYIDFVWLMTNAYLIITDSGGIQEEAPTLGKPVLLTRHTTERPEAEAAGVVKLVGTTPEKIITAVEELLTDSSKYLHIAQTKNPFGDGRAAERIINILLSKPFTPFKT
ncbi:MAG: UDP-N-acetylglucosamine 2-epimerase (non-hydrolyzing) [Candidatus Sumerlaeia bacterium]|nr:UDP-N-acetylglucosamine 2-epimerase (non-hydrolyzing) [Candidatus Sumerlaeia bacterium]